MAEMLNKQALLDRLHTEHEYLLQCGNMVEAEVLNRHAIQVVEKMPVELVGDVRLECTGMKPVTTETHMPGWMSDLARRM
jgi:hypothetical protein